MKLIYTEKAERDGVGHRGAPVEDGADVAYLELHGYCEAEEIVAETTALGGPGGHGAIKASRKVKP